MLNKYKVILWDFDGVILDSMRVRDLGFVKVLEQEGFAEEQIDQLLVYHRANGGLSRYVKFRYFYEVILNQFITEDKVLQLANAFSVIMLNLLIDNNLVIQDAVTFIANNHKDYRFHIVSGSDGIELNKICEGLNLSQYFHSIQGSPTPKKQLVKDLINTYNYNVEDLCLIGDSINDYEAADVNGIDFIGYNNLSIKNIGIDYIQNFN